MRFYSRGSVIMTKRPIMKINCKYTPTHMDSAMAVTVNVPTFVTTISEGRIVWLNTITLRAKTT